MLDFAQGLRDAYPGMFVHNVALADGNAADQRATVFGQLNDQVEQVCQQLADIPELSDGFDAIGFSQGGQFMRAYVQRCNAPPVRNLITFGSQHTGIADLPSCAPNDLLCRAASGLLRGGVNTDYAQSHFVIAQYYRNPRNANEYKGYLEHNHFLLDINNEVDVKEQYKCRLSSLENLVLVTFSEEQTVLPKESGWFAAYPIAEEGQPPEDDVQPIPLHQSKLYKVDRLGLRSLDRRGGLVFDTCQGGHMAIDAACQTKILGRWVGTPKSPVSAWLWRPTGRLLRYVGIHGGSWTGPLRWPEYNWLVNPDGSRRLQIAPSRIGSLGGNQDQAVLINIDYDVAELLAMVAMVIVLIILLWKVVIVLLIAALSAILLPGLLIGAALALPVVVAMFLVGCVVYLPFAVLASLIRRATAGHQIMLVDPAWQPRTTNYGSTPATPFTHLGRPATVAATTDVEAQPPSYDEVFDHRPSSRGISK